jgi:DNA-binding beta-propeller fold protein YncE
VKRALQVLALSVALTSCGDPLVLLGDLPGLMRIVTGLPNQPGARTDSIATRTTLFQPSVTVVNDSGTLFVIDDQRRIMSVTPGGRMRELHRGPACFDGSCLMRPLGATVAGQALLIADFTANRIWRFDLNSRSLTSIAGTGQAGTTPDGAVAAQARLFNPADVIVLADGRIVISERQAHKIRLIGADGRLQTLAGTGERGYSGDDGPASAARLSNPTGLSHFGSTLYFADHDNAVIRAIDLATGTIRTIAGVGVAGYGGDEGPAIAAKLDQPWAVEVSRDGGTLYFTEVGNHRVRAVNLGTGIITTFAGTGSTQYNGNGLSAGETSLFSPFGLAAAPQGYLYIADTMHHIVWRTVVRF